MMRLHPHQSRMVSMTWQLCLTHHSRMPLVGLFVRGGRESFKCKSAVAGNGQARGKEIQQEGARGLSLAPRRDIHTRRMEDGWVGLDIWRQGHVCSETEEKKNAVWSSKRGPCAFSEATKGEQDVYMALRMDACQCVQGIRCGSLVEYGKRVLSSADPVVKAELTHKAWREFASGEIGVHVNDTHQAIEIETATREERGIPTTLPARPKKPELVPAREIPTLKETTLGTSAYTLHTLAHVELNAIDLAWDTVVRFAYARLPDAFYADFARVADDESRHLGWCLQRLWELDCRYGDMPAHNLLWEGCMLSSEDIRERLAVVPMSQEARGLDAGGRLAERLVGWGDNVSASIVAQIAEEEHAHVAVGVHWFKAICKSLGDDSKHVFINTLTELCPDLLRPPFNHDARSLVGLPREYYDETSWEEESRAKIEHIRETRRRQNPTGHGMLVETAHDESLRLSPIDFDLLRERLALFLSQEGDACD